LPCRTEFCVKQKARLKLPGLFMNRPWERRRLAGALLISSQQLAGETPALPGSWPRCAIVKSRRLPKCAEEELRAVLTLLAGPGVV
jgi:hypothetical protein